jgi:class 3 adenylate cyclase
MRTVIPQVSLITSWYVPPPGEVGTGGCLPALELALKNRIAVHDLYFLSPADIAFYHKAAKMPERLNYSDPLAFAADLLPQQIKYIAVELTSLLTKKYVGPLVGPRPRFSALATYWPLISLPSVAKDEDKHEDEDQVELFQPGRKVTVREASILAVRNSLLLARELGCSHVEAVGGAAVPEHPRVRAKPCDPEDYRRRRLTQLTKSITQVYEQLPKQDAGRWPFLCLEVEPGNSFLIRDLQAFKDLRKRLTGAAANGTLLNVDIAHMMLLEDDMEKTLKKLRRFKPFIGHFHISDHSRSHAADLAPGTYHSFPDYKGFLEIAVELTSKADNNKFSRTIAVELEAIADIHEAARVVALTSSWLHQIRDEPCGNTNAQGDDISGAALSGALLAVDLGNSTEALIANMSFAKGARNLEKKVGEVCEAVHGKRGSVLSYTGDGVIAFFQDSDFLESKEAAVEAAVQCASQVEKLLDSSGPKGEATKPMTVRAAVHHGEVYIPVAGRLRHQAIGREVVVVARLCDWIAKTIESAVPPQQRRIIVALTAEAWKYLPRKAQYACTPWEGAEFKGLPDKFTVHIPGFSISIGTSLMPTDQAASK